MRINTVLPIIIPITIALGLIGYNEMNDNILLKTLKDNTQTNIVNQIKVANQQKKHRQFRS